MTTPAVASPLLGSTTAPVATGGSARDQLAGVAKQFEAVFLRQMLATARKSDFGDTLFSDDQAMGTFQQMQDERFADIAADTGAFGLAKMIEAQLARFLPPESPPADGTASAAGQNASTGEG